MLKLKSCFFFVFFLICDRCPQHFTSPKWNGAEMIKKKEKKHHINAVDQKTDSTEHLLLWSASVICSMCMCLCVTWCGGGSGGWGLGGFIIRSCGIKVGAAIKSRASAPGSNMPQSQQSSTGSQEDPGQATSREEIDAHEPASSAGKHRFPSEMWEWPSASSSIISFINNKKRNRRVKVQNAPSALLRIGPFRKKNKKTTKLKLCYCLFNSKYIYHSPRLLTIGKQMISKHLKSPFKNDKNLEFGIIKVEAKLSL